MFTATGFIVMWVAAVSTCTANAVESPPSPCGPTPSMFTAWPSSSSSLAPSGSSQRVPSARVAASFARCTHRSAVPPTPTPTMVGGQVLPPASSTQSITNVLMASTPSAGTAILSHELFSEPEPFGTISITSASCSSEKSTLMIGTPRPHEVCSRSEEHTSELQSHLNLVCRLLLEKKKKKRSVLQAVKKKTKLHK